MKPLLRKALLIGIVAVPIAIVSMLVQDSRFEVTQIEAKKTPTFDEQVDDNAKGMVNQGRQIFRFDTFGDQDFWGYSSNSTKQSQVRQMEAWGLV